MNMDLHCLDLRISLIYGQDEPSRQNNVSMSKVISFDGYRANTERHTQQTYCNTWTTNSSVKILYAAVFFTQQYL